MSSPRATVLRFWVAGWMAACAPSQSADEPAPPPAECPAGQPEGARCWSGQDREGAYYIIVVPPDWNGTLLLHAHGGPSLGDPQPDRALADLRRWTVMVRSGFAFAASTYRQGGVEVRAAAEDTERLRRLFVQHIARPERTILHGQSWGANVAAKGAETYTAGRPYDGVLLTSGVLAGGSRAYDFRLDLRVVYQAYCGNHPRSDEVDYPLWMGLPAGAMMTPADLAERAEECLGLGLPEGERSPEQAQRLRDILGVIRVPERTLLSHLMWGTRHFQDIVHNRTGGRSPFGNIGAHYRGSHDDAALNASVERYRADPLAASRFAEDSDLEGRIPVPVLTVHAIQDPTAFVEMEASFAETMARGGSGDRLVQTFTDHDEHSYLADAVYVALTGSLIDWIDRGEKPSPASIAVRCADLESTWGTGCRFRPDYRPPRLETRVPERERS